MLFNAMMLSAWLAAFALVFAGWELTMVKAGGAMKVAAAKTTGQKYAASNLVAEMGAIEAQVVSSGNPYGALPTPAPMGAVALCSSDDPCGLQATATYAYDGDTSTVAQANVTAPNVETATGVTERRVAVTMNVNVLDANAKVVGMRPQRVYLRLWAPNNAEIIAAQDSGSKTNRIATGSAEDGGCAADGTGCDAARATTADPTTVDALTQCVIGAGSGTCAPGETKSVQQKQNQAWGNQQATASSGP